MTPRYLLEDDFELWLVNAQHVKNVPAPDCLSERSWFVGVCGQWWVPAAVAQ
jgi:hypothetical protein